MINEYKNTGIQRLHILTNRLQELFITKVLWSLRCIPTHARARTHRYPHMNKEAHGRLNSRVCVSAGICSWFHPPNIHPHNIHPPSIHPPSIYPPSIYPRTFSRFVAWCCKQRCCYNKQKVRTTLLAADPGGNHRPVFLIRSLTHWIWDSGRLGHQCHSLWPRSLNTKILPRTQLVMVVVMKTSTG